MLLSALGFLAILAPLVIVHELGHFFFAKLFRVRADVFSVGFGPRLFSKQWGETEFRLALIPLGGFVKLLGEDPEKPLTPEEAKRALHTQASWKRFFIFFGGPLFNFIWAMLVFSTILFIGEPQLASVVGRVLPGSPAQVAGFHSGDRILSIQDQSVKKFEEVAHIVSEHPKQELLFRVQRPSLRQEMTLKATPSAKDGFTPYGESTQVGEIEGLLPTARSAQVGISNPESAAAKAGMQTGYVINEFNGQLNPNFEDLERSYAVIPEGISFSLHFKTADAKADFEGQKITWTKPRGSKGLASDFGLYSNELFVDRTLPKSPADRAGLQKGDRLVKVGDTPVRTFFELKDRVQSLGEKNGAFALAWERAGKLQEVRIEPTATQTKDALLNTKTQYTIGVIPMLTWAEPDTEIERIYNPFVLLVKGTERMIDLSAKNLISITKMFTGDVSVATLGGPILIGKLAGESISRGLIAFLSTMGVLSVGLGVLNLLPVPILDGGHIVLLLVEGIRRRPLTLKQMEVVQQIGLVFILTLMVIVIKNDLSRVSLFN